MTAATSKDDDTKAPAAMAAGKDDTRAPAGKDDTKVPDDTKASDTATSDDGNATASAKADDGKATATATVTAPKPAARTKAAAKGKAADDAGDPDQDQDGGPAYDGTTDGAERVTPGPGDSGLSARQLRAADVASAEAYAKDGIWGAPGSEVPGAKTPTAQMTQA